MGNIEELTRDRKMSWRAGRMLEKVENIKHDSGMDKKEQPEVKLLMMKKRTSRRGPKNKREL